MIPVPLWLLGTAFGVMIAATGGAYIKGRSDGAALALAKPIAEASAKAREQEAASNEIETVYVDRIQRVEVPIDRVRRELVAGVCPGSGTVSVPPGHAIKPADGPASQDPNAGIVRGIANDSAACIRNAQQLEALQALVRANTEK